MVRLLRSLFVVVLMVGPGLVTVACDDPPPPGPVTPRPSEFDPIVATAAVGTLPGAAEVTTDGTFAYTMPIDVPPGRAGMQPSLSISYDSGGGETALGVGFALRGLSALSRCPRNPAQDGVRAGISFTTDDRLCLDGMRLVAESGTYGEDAVYRTELDDLVRVEHRGEGEDGVLGASSFRVRYPDGREAVYGLTAESRLVAPRPDGSSVVESWLLAELRDASGNAVVYRYEHEAPRLFGVGDDEAGRPLRTRDSVRISRIDYTAFRGDDGVLEAGTRSVRFEYGEERRPNVGSCDDFVPDDGVATGSLCTTPPPHDGFAHGAAIYTPSVRPLERIQTYVGGTLASEYRIEGSEHPASRVFHVTSVTRCANAPAATPADADPSGLVCMPPTVFEWRDRFVDPQTSHLDPRYGLPTFQSWSAATDRARIHYLETRGWRDGAFWMIRRDNPIRALDLDGDGADDVAYLRQVGDRDDTGALYVAWGNPAPRTRAGLTAATTPFTTTSELSLRAMLPELRVDPAFLLSQLRAMRPVDWDQDGRDDLLVVLQPPENAARPRTEGPVVVLRSPGRTRGTAPSRVTLEMIDTGLDIPLADGTAGGRMLYDYVLTDMNGDGRQDLLACVYDVELSVCADNHAILGPVTGISPGTGCRGHWAISVRGETGLQPLVYSDVASDCGYEFGNGHVSSFSFPQDGFDSGGHWSIQPAAGDFDGDGRFEVVIGPEYATSLAAEATSDYTTELGRRRWPRRMLSFDGVNLTAEPIAGFVRPEGQLTVVDVNGDGLHDLVAQDAAFGEADASPVVIHLSTGEGFLAEEIAFAHPGARHVRTRADAGDGRPIRFPIRFLPFDMNRDGRGDLVVSTLRAGRTMPTRSSDFSRTWTWDAESVWMAELPSGAEAYLYSTGVALRWNEYLEGTGGRMPREMRRHDTLVLDGDGDGALDLLDWESVDPDAAATSFRIFHHNVRAEAMVVEHVEDGLGARIDVDYSNSSDAAVYTPGTSCTYPQRCVTDARELVSALHRDDGLGARRTTRYTYLDGRADLAGRGFLGYGQIREVDQTTGIETTTTYDHATRISVGGGHAYPYARRPIARVSFRRDLFTGLDSIRFEGTRERFDYDLTEPGPGRYRVRPLLTFSETLERRSATARGADPFNGARTIRNSLHAFQDYDEHGFARTEITAAGPDNTVATLTYDHDPSSWRFGMVAEITTDAYNGDPGCEREVVTRFVNDLPRALVVEVVRNPDDAATRRSTALGYDRYGNVTEVTRRTDDGTRGETIAWDIEGYFPFELTNAAGHVTTTAYEPRFGGLRASVDPNWVERRAYIDGFGRPRIEESDLGDHSEVAYTRGSTPDTVHVEAQSNVEGRASVELDRLGRVFRSAVFHAYRQSTTDVRYDTRGRVVGVSEPHGTETVFPETVYTYDGLDRLRRVTRPETGDVTSYRFDINAVEVTDPAGAETRTEHDLRGRVRRMVEADPEVRGETDAVTSYTYCMGDELRSIRDDAGNVTRVHYDRLGRRTGLVDPDVGAESYEYDAWDQLLRTTDNAGRISRLSHDVLGRVTDRFDDADGAHFRWEYDTALGPSGRAVLGMLAEAESGDGVVDRFEYDALHRPSAVTRTIDGRSLTLAQSFDTVGRVRQVDYPSIGGDGVSVRYGYHARGDLVSVSDAETGEMYWELLNQEIHGLPNSETVGPLARATSYSATGRLRGIEVTTDAGEALQDVSYNYEARGLLRSRTDRVREQAELVTHDLLGRLTGLFGERTETYDYDLLGNLASSHDSTLDYDGRAARGYSADHGGGRGHRPRLRRRGQRHRHGGAPRRVQPAQPADVRTERGRHGELRVRLFGEPRTQARLARQHALLRQLRGRGGRADDARAHAHHDAGRCRCTGGANDVHAHRDPNAVAALRSARLHRHRIRTRRGAPALRL